MKTILLIFAFFLLNSCCGGVAYDGRYATYSIDEQGRITIAPHIHAQK